MTCNSVYTSNAALFTLIVLYVYELYGNRFFVILYPFLTHDLGNLARGMTFVSGTC